MQLGMIKEKQIEQLKLATRLLETGHPWEYRDVSKAGWHKGESVWQIMCAPVEFEIRPILATPPDGRDLHNPDNLTAEQVGVGYRLVVGNDTFYTEAERWHRGTWLITGNSHAHSRSETYRLPLSTPWPDAPKPFQLPPPAKRDFGPEDVPPGSVFCMRAAKLPHVWCSILKVNWNGIIVSDKKEFSWKDLRRDPPCQINRSLPLTGKWNPDAWEDCVNVADEATASGGRR